MKCQNCQKELTPEDQICPNCGVPTVNHTQAVEQPAPVQEVVMEPSSQAQTPVQQEIIMEPAPLQPQETPVKLRKPKKNKSSVPIILLIIIIVGAIGALVYFYRDEIFHSKQSGGISYRVVYKDMEMYIPYNYIYEIKDNYIFVSDDTNTWEAKIEKFSGQNYKDYKSNPNYIKEKFANLNYKIINSKTEEYTAGDKDISMLMLETVIEEKNVLIGILEKDSENAIIVSIIRNDNTYDYERLEKFVPILNFAVILNLNINNSNENITINEIFNKEIIEPDIPNNEEPVIDEENTTPPQTEEEIIDPNPEAQNEPGNELNE